jgi:hypothetical protein
MFHNSRLMFISVVKTTHMIIITPVQGTIEFLTYAGKCRHRKSLLTRIMVTVFGHFDSKWL